MLSLNRAQIIGHLTRDPELRTTPSGQSVANFSVATNRRWSGRDGEQQESTEFHDVVAWGKLAEIVGEYFKKGQRVYVEGRLQTRSWEAQDGSKRQRTEIIAENAINLSPRPQEIPAQDLSEEESQVSKKEKVKAGTKTKTPAKEEEINIDDIPF